MLLMDRAPFRLLSELERGGGGVTGFLDEIVCECNDIAGR
jgi:hypothetical protein